MSFGLISDLGKSHWLVQGVTKRNLHKPSGAVGRAQHSETAGLHYDGERSSAKVQDSLRGRSSQPHRKLTRCVR